MGEPPSAEFCSLDGNTKPGRWSRWADTCGVPSYGYSANNGVNSGEMTLGILMILGGFVYSPIDAYFASETYNQELAHRLGLPMGFTLAPAPIHTDRSVAWGPALSFRF